MVSDQAGKNILKETLIARYTHPVEIQSSHLLICNTPVHIRTRVPVPVSTDDRLPANPNDRLLIFVILTRVFLMLYKTIVEKNI